MVSTTTFRNRAKRARVYVADLWDRRGFAWFLAMSNLKAQNASTSLGLLWWVLNPLLLGLVYFFIFGIVFQTGRDIIYLMSGMFAFHYTSKSLSGGANSILRNARLLVNLRFPRLILPLANLIENGIGFFVSLGVLYAMVLIVGGATVTPALMLLPVIFFVQFIFNLGLGTITARLAVPFRDINNFIPYFNRIWLYTSPIIWPLSRLDSFSEDFSFFLSFNPMFSFLAVYRAALLGYDFDPTDLWTAIIWAVVVGVIGVTLFIRYERKMVRYL